MPPKKPTKKPTKKVSHKPSPPKVSPPKREDDHLEGLHLKEDEEEVDNGKEEKEENEKVLVREADKTDIEAAKPQAPTLPVAGPKEQLFECPNGHVKVGPSDRNSDWCGICGVTTNPRR